MESNTVHQRKSTPLSPAMSFREWLLRWDGDFMMTLRNDRFARLVKKNKDPADWLRVHLPIVIGDVMRDRPNVRFTLRFPMAIIDKGEFISIPTYVARHRMPKGGMGEHDDYYCASLDNVVDAALEGGELFVDPVGLLATHGLRHPDAPNYVVAAKLIYDHVKGAFAASSLIEEPTARQLLVEGSNDWEPIDRALLSLIR